MYHSNHVITVHVYTLHKIHIVIYFTLVSYSPQMKSDKVDPMYICYCDWLNGFQDSHQTDLIPLLYYIYIQMIISQTSVK